MHPLRALPIYYYSLGFVLEKLGDPVNIKPPTALARSLLPPKAVVYSDTPGTGSLYNYMMMGWVWMLTIFPRKARKSLALRAGDELAE